MKTEWYGKYRAIVADVNDPERRGRIRVRCPKVLGDYLSAWCEPCIPYATDFAGDFYVPPVNEAIWVEFEEGDPNKPIWNGGWYRPNSTPLLPEHTQDEYRYIAFKKSTLRIGYAEFAFEIKVENQSKILRIDKDTWVGLHYISTRTEEELVDLNSLITNKEFILTTFPSEVRSQFQDVSASLTYLDSQFNAFTGDVFNPFANAVNAQLEAINESLTKLTAKLDEIDRNLEALQEQIGSIDLSVIESDIRDIKDRLDRNESDIQAQTERLDWDKDAFNITIDSLWENNIPDNINEFTFYNMY